MTCSIGLGAQQCAGWLDLAASICSCLDRSGALWLARSGCPGRCWASILLRMGSVFIDFAAQGQCFVKVALGASMCWPCALLGVLAASFVLLWMLLGALAGSIWLPWSLLRALAGSI